MESGEEGAAGILGIETGGTSGVGNEKSPRDALRDSDHMFVALCDNRGADACSHREFVAPCDNLVASDDNTGAYTAVSEFDAPCDNFVASCDNMGADTAVSASGSSSTYSGRVLFSPVVPRGSVALCNNLVTPCDNEVEHGDNLVASCDNTGADIVVLASGSVSTYSGRVLLLPVLPRGSVALCNNLVTPCDNEVEQGRSPTPDGGEETAPEPHAR